MMMMTKMTKPASGSGVSITVLCFSPHRFNPFPSQQQHGLLITVVHLQALHLQFISIVNNRIISWCDGVDWDKYIAAPHHF